MNLVLSPARHMARQFQMLPIRLGFAMAVCLGVFAAGHSVANAECGNQMFKSTLAPLFQKAEAIPLTPDNIFQNAFGDSKVISATAGIFGLTPCMEDTPVTRQAQTVLVSLWRDAINIRAAEAALKYVDTGKTAIPSSCYPFEKMALRAMIANGYYVHDADGPAVVKLVKASPYYADINALWNHVFADAGMQRPATGTATVAWAVALSHTAAKTKETLPSNVYCPDQPEQTKFPANSTP